MSERKGGNEDSVEIVQSSSAMTEQEKKTATTQLKTGLKEEMEGWQRSETEEFCYCLPDRKFCEREARQKKRIKIQKIYEILKEATMAEDTGLPGQLF